MVRLGWVGVMAALAGFQVAQAASGGGPPDGIRLPARGGTIVLKVTDYDSARQAVVSAAREQGAEGVLSSRTEVDYQGKQHGWMRLRVSADRLTLLLPVVRGVGKLYAERMNTQDHTSEYEELERRIGRLREHQPRLASLLQTSRRLRGSDILFVQERLFRAGVDEGALMQRRADLERSARVATLVVELFEPEPRRAMQLGNYYAGAALRARGALYRYAARALTVGAYVLIFAPLWVPGLLALVLLARWAWRRLRLLAARLAPLGALMAEMMARHMPERMRLPRSPDATTG